jgi:hypothetical protein
VYDPSPSNVWNIGATVTGAKGFKMLPSGSAKYYVPGIHNI